MTKKLLGLLLVPVLVIGCSSTPPPAADTDKLAVLASFYPLEFLSSRIGGDEVSVTGLTAPGAEPHDLELSPRQIADLSKADLVVYEKGFQVSVDDAIETASPPLTVDVSAGIELLPAIDGGPDDEADPEDAGAGTLDPHIWLDPVLMSTMADSVTEALMTAKPTAAETFTANNAAIKAELQTLDTDFETGLQTCERREFVTTHSAFSYLANRYDLTQIAIKGMDPESEPSPARIAAVQEEAKAYGITTIFYETLVSPSVAQSIANDLGLKTAVLDPIEGITDRSAGSDYIAVMRANLGALQSAGGCS